jgi:hypothetical protein
MHHHARRAPGDGNPKPSEVLPALDDRGGASPTEPPAGKQARHYLIRLRSTSSGDDIRRLRLVHPSGIEGLIVLARGPRYSASGFPA